MADIDRDTARALVDAGYMPLREYIERFGNAACPDPQHVDSPATAPDMGETCEPVVQASAYTIIEGR